MRINLIRAHGGQGQTLLVPPPWLEAMGLEDQQQVKIKFGQKEASVYVHRHQGEDGFYFARQTLHRLYLKTGFELQVRWVNDTIHLGPLIGIMTTPLRRHTEQRTWPLESRHSRYFAQFARLGARYKGLIYLFTPEQVDWERKVVHGYAFANSAQGGQWVKGTFPLPDVIWNKVPNRGAERRPDVMRVKRKAAASKSMRLFPQDYFYKWSLYTTLRNEGSVSHYLPETRLLHSMTDIDKMLTKYGVVFIKPCSGSHGHGIVRLERMSSGGVRYAYTHKGHTSSNVLYTKEQLQQFFAQFLIRKNNVVQQGLNLAHYRDRPYDLRATVQKGQDGQWQIVGMSAKIAGKHSVTTHVGNGGKVVPVEWLFKQLYGEDQEKLKAVEAMAIGVSEAIERATGWFLGELGMDIAIDKKGKLWLFEINSKPGRIVFAPRWARGMRRRSYDMLVQYAVFLAGFGTTEDTKEGVG